jgi:hypothetical protein
MAAKGAARGRAVTGTIAGFVLRMARESLSENGTQMGMAETVGVDLATWQGWESGRRPLANMKAGSLLELRRRLLGLGGDPALLGLLDPAMDADRILSYTIEHDDGRRHPLADWVHTRDTAHMLAWALNGTAPVGYFEIARTALGGFGGTAVDHWFLFNVPYADYGTGSPGTADLSLTFAAVEAHLSLSQIAIDTATSSAGFLPEVQPIPEPSYAARPR